VLPDHPHPYCHKVPPNKVFFSPEEIDFDGNLCASIKNPPLGIKLGSVPMNLEGAGVEYIQLYFVFVNTNAGCQLPFFKRLLN
jgi:hypothetical protein